MGGSETIPSFCLSSATVLRCASLTRFQNIVIVIPTALEVVFTTVLVFILWNSGHRRHLLLTAEGWVYLLLTILDLLSHVLNPARMNLDVYNAFDVAIGVASFLPIFFYTFFLYIYSNSELLSNTPALPTPLAKIASLLLLIAIPAIVTADLVVGVNPNDPAELLVGFSSRHLFNVNAFFASLTLALVTLFQVIVFLIAFFRMVTAVLNQRRFETSGKDAAHLVRGIAWLSIGMKLGAIETVIGFAGGGFGIVFTRRTMRFLSRACLCIGIVKGVDEIEDFRAVRGEMKSAIQPRFFQRNSQGLRDIISNPRASTFRPLSPVAKSFYGLPRAHLFQTSSFDFNNDAATPPADHSPARAPRERLRSLQEISGMATFGEPKDDLNRKPSSRVTIGYNHSSGAPTLQLRISVTSLPSPSAIAESIKSKPEPSWESSASRARRDSGYASPADPQKRVGDDQMYQTSPTLEMALNTMAPPSRKVFTSEDNRDSGTSAHPSFADFGQAEIITASQRNLSQRSARARLYPASIIPANPATMLYSPSDTPTEERPPSYPTSPFASTDGFGPSQAISLSPSRSSTGQLPSKSRATSRYSAFSVPETLRAVRELTKKFPGPPITFNGRPLMGGLGQNLWEDGSSVVTTPSAFTSGRSSFAPRALGSPTELKGGWRDSYYKRQSTIGPSDEEMGISRAGTNYEYRVSTSKNEGDLRGSRVYVANKDIETLDNDATPKPSVLTVAPPYAPRSIDPFQDEENSSKTPIAQRFQSMPPAIVKPSIRTYPLLETSGLSPNNLANSHMAPEDRTPTSVYSLGRPALSSSALGSTDDIFSERAVRTGGSANPSKAEVGLEQRNTPTNNGGKWDPSTAPLPSIPNKALTIQDAASLRFSTPSISGQLLAGSVNDARGISNLDKKPVRRPPSTIVWNIPERDPPRDRNSVDEERRRQQSIDAAAHLLSNSIPWLKNPKVEEEERQFAKAISSSALMTRRPQISRIKTTNNAAKKLTPPPTRHIATSMRGSLHMGPIVIPSQVYGSNLEVIKDDASDGPRVLKDSQVFRFDGNRGAVRENLETD